MLGDEESESYPDFVSSLRNGLEFISYIIQSTLAISTSVISNNWLSRSEILVP